MNQIQHDRDLISAPNWPYDQAMEAQTPPQHHPTQYHAGPPQPHQQPWPPYPGYPPPQPPRRRWLPYATLGAIIIAGALIAAAIVIAGGDKSSRSAAAPSTTQPAASASGGIGATCKAWRTTSSALDAIPQLPDGWDWDTPNINTLIASGNAAIGKALDIFQAEINPNDSPEVVSAAKEYISDKRSEMAKLSDHTYTEADGVPENVAFAKLNQLCGVK